MQSEKGYVLPLALMMLTVMLLMIPLFYQGMLMRQKVDTKHIDTMKVNTLTYSGAEEFVDYLNRYDVRKRKSRLTYFKQYPGWSLSAITLPDQQPIAYKQSVYALSASGTCSKQEVALANVSAPKDYCVTLEATSRQKRQSLTYKLFIDDQIGGLNPLINKQAAEINQCISCITSDEIAEYNETFQTAYDKLIKSINQPKAFIRQKVTTSSIDDLLKRMEAVKNQQGVFIFTLLTNDANVVVNTKHNFLDQKATFVIFIEQMPNNPSTGEQQNHDAKGNDGTQNRQQNQTDQEQQQNESNRDKQERQKQSNDQQYTDIQPLTVSMNKRSRLSFNGILIIDGNLTLTRNHQIDINHIVVNGEMQNRTQQQGFETIATKTNFNNKRLQNVNQGGKELAPGSAANAYPLFSAAKEWNPVRVTGGGD